MGIFSLPPTPWPSRQSQGTSSMDITELVQHHRFSGEGIEAELEANEAMVTEPRVRVEGSITLIFSSHSPPLLCFPTTPLPLPYKQLTDFTPAHSQGESAEEMPSRILSAELK